MPDILSLVFSFSANVFSVWMVNVSGTLTVPNTLLPGATLAFMIESSLQLLAAARLAANNNTLPMDEKRGFKWISFLRM